MDLGTKFNAAMIYVSKGFPVLPIHWTKNGKCSCGKQNCKDPGKHPIGKLVPHGLNDATTDPQYVVTWWMDYPLANVAIAVPPGYMILDVDVKSSGFDSLDALEQQYGKLPPTWEVHTGGGGRHYWFTTNNGTIKSSTGFVGAGLDVKANGGYVIMPPSDHITGGVYEWEVSTEEDDIPVALPSWLEKLAAPAQAPKQQPTKNKNKIPQGKRNSTLTSIAGRLRRAGMSELEILAALQGINQNRCDPTLGDKELATIARSVSKYSVNHHLTDLGNGLRFCDLHQEDVRYCYPLKEFLTWDRKHWVIGDMSEVTKRAHRVVMSIYSEASREKDPKRRKEIAAWAHRSEAQTRITNLLNTARPYIAVQPQDLDTHPGLLTAANGIVDLSTGELLPHDLDRLITKMIDVDYDTDAPCPHWLDLLNLITGGDPQMVNFLKVAIGYSLTGRTDEHCLFYLYGVGKNGKTTFSKALEILAGEYYMKMDIEALLAQKYGNNATPYVAALQGKRVVVCSEMPEGRRINESLLKDLTGGDTIVARKLHSNPTRFTAEHKLWMFGNYQPKVKGDDEGIWRRFRIVPFKVTINRPRPMGDVLAEFRSELPGILAWAVEGAIEWFKTKELPACDAVDQATQDYRNSEDVLGEFLSDRCDVDISFDVPKTTLYQEYRNWCISSGEYPQSKRWLTLHMKARGFASGGHGNLKFMGLKVKP